MGIGARGVSNQFYSREISPSILIHLQIVRSSTSSKKHHSETLIITNTEEKQKKVREKSGECRNHKPQALPDPKRKRKPTNPNKHKSNKRTKSTKISSLFPKRGNRNTKRTEKHKNEMTHGKTYNKSPRRINHKATKSKTNTGTTALQSLGPYGDLKPESKPHQYIMHVSKKEPFTVWLQYSSLIG